MWGDDRGDELVVGRFEKLAAANDSGDRVVRGLTTVTPKTSRNAFVMVDVGGGVNLTTASANSTVFSPGKNFAGQYSLMSFGGEIYTGDVLGPFSYPMTSCDWDGLATTMRTKVPAGYDHYMWYMGSMVNACDWSGIGAEGSAAAPESDAWFNQATDCGTLVQEVGHNNGWMHSSTLKCSGAPFADNPATACTTDEYGNLYSPMGFGDCGHFVAMDKWYGGYFGGCNLVKVASTATLNLMPIEIPCNGIQGIQIAMPKTTRSYTAEQDDRPTALKYYYLELRVNGTPGETTLIKAPTVLVIVGDNLGATNRESTHTFLLDMNPSTNSYDGMTAAGQSFSDPAGGLTFSVVSIDKTQATIQVTYTNGSGAGPTCIDGSPLVGSGPIDCGGGTTGTGGAGGGAGSGGAGGTGGASGGGGRGGAAGGTTGAAAARGVLEPGAAGARRVRPAPREWLARRGAPARRERRAPRVVAARRAQPEPRVVRARRERPGRLDLGLRARPAPARGGARRPAVRPRSPASAERRRAGHPAKRLVRLSAGARVRRRRKGRGCRRWSGSRSVPSRPVVAGARCRVDDDAGLPARGAPTRSWQTSR